MTLLVEPMVLCVVIVWGSVEGPIIITEQPRLVLAKQGEMKKSRVVNEEPAHLSAPVCLWLVLAHSVNPNSPMLDSLESPPRAVLTLQSSPQTAHSVWSLPLYMCATVCESVPSRTLSCPQPLIDWRDSYLICIFPSVVCIWFEIQILVRIWRRREDVQARGAAIRCFKISV